MHLVYRKLQSVGLGLLLLSQQHAVSLSVCGPHYDFDAAVTQHPQQQQQMQQSTKGRMVRRRQRRKAPMAMPAIWPIEKSANKDRETHNPIIVY